ncbi:Lrp/AsnC family transcriptional regulator [Streptomyces roseoverticillatus]|uniref:Lrp/AsnC family transcriptional regulator n=1 Tax=Streptomyces roseoverticillatus TaxID=66429 RepID=UPI0004C21AE1|nr:Lrp/AsnC family transcriptional regulator [Streptomyces roseoverticillatus]
MDDLDRAIIMHLQQDGRLTHSQLAERIGLTPSPVLRRVKRLEQDGVITGYRARIDPVAAGRSFEVMVTAELRVNNRENVEAFEERVASFDEVVECRRLFGLPDYLIWVAVADLESFERFLTAKLMDLPAVARVSSHFTMRVVKPRA